jgi:hypothetical protein
VCLENGADECGELEVTDMTFPLSLQPALVDDTLVGSAYVEERKGTPSLLCVESQLCIILLSSSSLVDGMVGERLLDSNEMLLRVEVSG